MRPENHAASVAASVKPSTALLSIGVGAVCLSFAAVITKWTTVEPTTIGVYRTTIATMTLVALIPFGGASTLGQPKSSRRRGLLWAAVSGVMFAGDLFVWHRSILMAGSGIATLLAHTQVFWVTILSVWLLGERLRLSFIGAVVVALLGIVLVTLPGIGVNTLHLEGVGLGLLTGVFYAAYVLTLRESRRGSGIVGLVPNLAVSSASCAAVLVLAALVTDEALGMPAGHDLVLLAVLGIGVHVGSWLLISRGMPHIPATSSSVLLLLQPLLAQVWGVWFYDEPMGLIGVLGVLLTLLGIYLTQRQRLSSKRAV